MYTYKFASKIVQMVPVLREDSSRNRPCIEVRESTSGMCTKDKEQIGTRFGEEI